MGPDFLQFEGGAVEHMDRDIRLAMFAGVPLQDDGALRVGWTGPWPPPERMGVAVGLSTGITKVFEPDALGDGVYGIEGVAVTLEELRTVSHVTIFRRVSFSPLPDGHTLTHVARGSLYRPET